MKIVVFLVYILFNLPLLLFSKGINEVPPDVQQLETLVINSTTDYSPIFKITLPYKKPYGIDEIFTADSLAVKKYRLIADGKIIPSYLNIMADIEEISKVNTETVPLDEMELKIDMSWEYNTNTIIHFEYLYKRNVNPFQYSIPRGCNEILFIYSIVFPDWTESKKRAVKWQIIWN